VTFSPNLGLKVTHSGLKVTVLHYSFVICPFDYKYKKPLSLTHY